MCIYMTKNLTSFRTYAINKVELIEMVNKFRNKFLNILKYKLQIIIYRLRGRAYRISFLNFAAPISSCQR
jgi:hypothetical protein